MKESAIFRRNIKMDDIKDTTDQKLVKLALANKQEFLALMQKYEKPLFYYIKRISGFSKEDAEDVLQDTFINIYKNLNAYDDNLKFSSWAYRIAHNQTISEFRKRKTRIHYFYEEKDLINLADNLDNVDSKNILHLRADIESTLAKIPDKYREVLVLKFIEEKDYKEISDILKKPIGTVGTLINRAKKKFQKEFK